MENLMFWGIILLMMLSGIKQRFLRSLSIAAVLMSACYVSFWLLEPLSTLTTLLPVNLGEWTKPIVFILAFGFLLVAFKPIMLASAALFEKDDEDETQVLSPKICICGAVCCNFFSGIAMATVLFTVVAIMPKIEEIPMLSSPEIPVKAKQGIRFISGTVDLLTFQKKHANERARLMRKSFNQMMPEEEEFFSE